MAGVPSIRVIDPSQWLRQPWRNGRGTTHEIVRASAADGELALRISVADIVEPGPFSHFAATRRWLGLLAGGPVTLEIAGARMTLADIGDGVAFAGDAPAAAVDVPTPSRDLNVMWRAGLDVAVQVWRAGDAGSAAGRSVAVVVLAGVVRLAAAGAGPRFALATHACAYATDDARCALAIDELPIGALAVVVRLT